MVKYEKSYLLQVQYLSKKSRQYEYSIGLYDPLPVFVEVMWSVLIYDLVSEVFRFLRYLVFSWNIDLSKSAKFEEIDSRQGWYIARIKETNKGKGYLSWTSCFIHLPQIISFRSFDPNQTDRTAAARAHILVFSHSTCEVIQECSR